MSEGTDKSPGRHGGPRIVVRRLVRVPSLKSHQIARAVRSTLGDQPVRAISVAVVDNAAMASLHERYFGDAAETDVLAFDLRDDDKDERIDGEIVVSAETARRQAARLGMDESQELLRYVIHGTLHLMGCDDHTPAGRRRMRQAEDRVLHALRREPAGLRPRLRRRRTKGGV